MKSAMRWRRRSLILLAVFAVMTIFGIEGSLASEVVELRGYGRVEALITPRRSQFTCETDAKADVLLGKLLADLFWDAGLNHAVKKVAIGGREAIIHLWQPYGAVVIARLNNHVLVIGGKDEQETIRLAEKEPLLGLAGVLFAPSKPYPKLLDFYDLGAIKCDTLGLNPENKFRYQDRAAFIHQFFPGGLHGYNMSFRTEPAEGVNTWQSMLDTEALLAEQSNQMYSFGISTGTCPEWVRNQWPGFIDRSSSIHNINIFEYRPEAFGITGQQRQQISLKFLHDIIRRYSNSPAFAGWQLYCGDYVWESFFFKSIQGHYGYTPAGMESFRQWLKDVRGYSLSTLGQNWWGDGGHFKSWGEVTPPDPDEFFGDFNASCLPIHDSWFWRKAEADEFAKPAASAPGWTRVAMPPSDQMLALPQGPSFWRSSFDAGDWLKKNAGKEAYLIFNVDNQGWRKTNVWLNDISLGEIQSKSDTYFGPFGLKVTELLKPGVNEVYFSVTGGGNPTGPVFLTTTLPRAYPYLGKLRNAQYVDAMQWRLHELNSKEIDAMKYARSMDPDMPFVTPATGDLVKDAQGLAVRQYGGSIQDTGYEASYRPFDSRLGYAAGFYGSCEQSGNTGIKEDPAAYTAVMTRRLSWMLSNGEGSYMEWRDPYCYYTFENKTGWFTKNKRGYQLIGKYLPEKPGVAILHSSLSALLGAYSHSSEWDIGRGELHANHYDNVCVTEGMVAEGLADAYPVLFDTDTMIMDQPTVDAIGKYVEKGGTFIALQNTGRHSLLEPDAWPISQISGLTAHPLDKKGKIRFENTLPIFKGWEGKVFEGEGSALDFKDSQLAKGVGVALEPAASDAIALARWEDGSIAVGMRNVGKGRIIVLGSTFWRNGRDLGGKGMWRTDHVEPVFIDRLLTDLGVQRTASASTPDVYARKVITKNGLQEWLIALNTTGVVAKADVGFAVSEKPEAVWDVTDNSSIPFTYADGWVWIKNAQVAPYGTRIFGVTRTAMAGGVDFWWQEKIKFWTRRGIVPPLVETPEAPNAEPPTISFTNWKFFADRDDNIGKADDWLAANFDDHAWRPADNKPWNLQFDDLRDYSGVGLYRSQPFSLPSHWDGKQITLNMDGMLRYCSTTFDLYINGQKIDAIIHPRLTVDVTDKLKKTGNVLCIKLTGKPPTGDYPLSGLLGCAVWIQPQVMLSPSMSLLGDWQAVQADWSTAQTAAVVGAPFSLTDDGRIKTGITPIKANHLVRDIDIPASWSGRNIWLHVMAPQMNAKPQVGIGLTGGMLIVNGKARQLDPRPNVPLDQMLNLTPDIQFGQKNRIELWTRNTCRGVMTEENIIINDIAIGCQAK